MSVQNSLKLLGRVLASEEAFVQALNESFAARQLVRAREELRGIVRDASVSGDLSLIVAVEREIVGGDLRRYANSLPMTRSLTTALNEIAAIGRHIDLVDDPVRYQMIDAAHSLPKNRRNGLPYDEARQALASHLARLGNLDKSRLGDDEKQIIDARRAALREAMKLYEARQARTLGVSRGRTNPSCPDLEPSPLP